MSEQRPLSVKEWLYDQYVEKEHTVIEIVENYKEISKKEGINTVRDDHRCESVPSLIRVLKHSGVADGYEEYRYRDKEWLHEQYLNRDNSMQDIARKCGVGTTAIHTWINRHNIDIKSSHNNIIQNDPEGEFEDFSYTGARTWIDHYDGCEYDIYDKEELNSRFWIRTQYVDKRRSISNIANELNTTEETVRDCLSRYGIEERPNAGSELSERSKEKLNDEKWLRTQHIENRRRPRNIARFLHVSTATVINHFTKYGMTRMLPEDLHPPEPEAILYDDSWLRRQYEQSKRPPHDIADQLDVPKETVVDRLSECNIDLRNGLKNPEHLGHIVRSEWELHIANLLNENDIEYEYECIEITWVDESGDEHTYTPDFVTENFVIEVKGRVWEEGNESTKARAAMDTIDDKQYMIIGTELPCDIHIEWGNEAALLERF